MPTLTKKHEILSRLNRDDAAAIVALIDLKTEEDMDKVLNKLDVMEKRFEAKFEALDAKFEAIDAKFGAVDSKLSAMDQKIDTKINTLYWFVGIMVTIAIAATKFL